jgi:nitronate monooxygenase
VDRDRGSNATQGYKQGIVEGAPGDIVYTNLFTGIHGNYLKSSILNAGLDPTTCRKAIPAQMNFGSGGNTEAKAGRTSGARARDRVGSRGGARRARVDRLEAEYQAAIADLAHRTGVRWD